MEITRGVIRKGTKFCVYGPEGIGKSTFVGNIPGIVYIDTEGSTASMDVPRLPQPDSWQMLLREAEYVRDHAQEFTAVVIDTADWAERFCTEAVCAAHTVNGKPMTGVEDAGYGKGYVYLYEEFGKLLNIMSQITDRGVHAGFTAHAMMRKFEQPDEIGAYDRWELKMSKKVAPLVKEWCDLLLFANYKTMVYATDDKGKSHKATGGKRVMYASHHVCWDAKNRFGLPDEMPFEFDAVARLFQPVNSGVVEIVNPAPQEQIPIPCTPAAPAATEQDEDPDEKDIPDALRQLMKMDGILPIEVKAAVAERGYFPANTPWANYPLDFVQGVLIGAWPQVKEMCLASRDEPF